MVTSLAVDDFNQWKKNKYEPEDFFFEMLGAIDGVSDMSRGTYTVRTHDGSNYIFIMDNLKLWISITLAPSHS